jgi:DNA-binding protein HU-beta
MTNNDYISNKELMKTIAEENNISVYRANKIFESLSQELARAMHDDKHVKVRGVGVFKPIRRPARKLHVPSTGETIDIPERSAIKFNPSKKIEQEE